MGISYPYLAILSIIAFIAAVTGVAFMYLYIIDQVNRTPVVGVYAEATILRGELAITITLKHVLGRVVELSSIRIYGEKELLLVFRNGACYAPGDPRIKCYVTGLREAVLLPGSQGYVKVILPLGTGYFYENKTYQGLVFFNEGTYPIAFTPLRLLELYPPPEEVLVLPVSFTYPLHEITCTSLNRTERRIAKSLIYTDFDKYNHSWKIDYYGRLGRRENVTNATTIGFSGNGVLLSEIGKEQLGVYYLDVELDKNITTVLVASRFKLVNGTGYYGLAYILAPEGFSKPAHEVLAVVINISSPTTGITLEAIYFDKPHHEPNMFERRAFTQIDWFDFSRWHVLWVNITKVTRTKLVIVSTILYDEFYNRIANISVNFELDPAGLPSRYASVLFNDTSIVVDDIMVAWDTMPPINIRGLPTGELYTVIVYDPFGILVSKNTSYLGYVDLWIPIALGNESKIMIQYPSSLPCLVYIERDMMLPGDVFNLTYRGLNITLGRLGGSASLIAAVSNMSNVHSGFTLIGVKNHDNTSYTLVVNITATNVTGNISLVAYNPVENRWVIIENTLRRLDRYTTNISTSTVLNPGETIYIYFIGFISGERASIEGVVEACVMEEKERVYCIELPMRGVLVS